jgi:hypothetical protein
MDQDSKILFLRIFTVFFAVSLVGFVCFYRWYLRGRYQTGWHLQSFGVALAVVGLGLGSFLGYVDIGARLIGLGFFVGLFGAYKQARHRNE